jgi:hypothetical protein
VKEVPQLVIGREGWKWTNELFLEFTRPELIRERMLWGEVEYMADIGGKGNEGLGLADNEIM